MVEYKTSQLVICKDNYETQEEFENAIKRAIMLLIENEYIMTIQCDEPGLGIVAIEYETSHIEWGAHYPHWLSPEEYEAVESYRNYEEEE